MILKKKNKNLKKSQGFIYKFKVYLKINKIMKKKLMKLCILRNKNSIIKQ